MDQMDEAIKNGTAVFVFGSNLAGIHGAGAARHAEEHWGAKRGVGVGLTGMAYGIPTKNHNINKMSLKQIKPQVDELKLFATHMPSITFKVTQIGCGLAGYKPEDIAPMFEDSPKNCWFDHAWYQWLGADYHYWGSL